MRAILRRLRRWALADYLTLIESVGWAVLIEVCLRLVPMSTIVALLPKLHRRSSVALQEEQWYRLARFAEAPYRLISGRGTCLRRSLILCALLRRRGLAAHICFGVAQRDGALAAHAWVDIAGSSVDSLHSEYLELTHVWSA